MLSRGGPRDKETIWWLYWGLRTMTLPDHCESTSSVGRDRGNSPDDTAPRSQFLPDGDTSTHTRRPKFSALYFLIFPERMSQRRLEIRLLVFLQNCSQTVNNCVLRGYLGLVGSAGLEPATSCL